MAENNTNNTSYIILSKSFLGRAGGRARERWKRNIGTNCSNRLGGSPNYVGITKYGVAHYI